MPSTGRRPELTVSYWWRRVNPLTMSFSNKPPTMTFQVSQNCRLAIADRRLIRPSSLCLCGNDRSAYQSHFNSGDLAASVWQHQPQ